MGKKALFCLFLLLCLSAHLQAQKNGGKIKYKAEKLTNARREDGVRFKKLLDKVVFKQNETIVYCDSAYFFKEDNRMEAFGRVRIKDGDSVTIRSKSLIYEGNRGMAKLRDNVVYKRGHSLTLYTDFLDYNLILEVAKFYNNGKLVDDNNTLTSNSGKFLSRSNYAYFYDDVLLVAPEYNLRADQMEYNTLTEVAYTRGPTFIDNRDGTTVDSDGGVFKTRIEQTTFNKGTIETRNYILVGDDIFIDDQKRFYKATGNVVMTSKKDNIIIFGDQSIYDKQLGISKVYGNPLMKKVMAEDTLFMSADTLVAIEHADKDKERVLAYHGVKMFKEDLQGICDSVAYFSADSTMHMYIDPLLWNEDNQMEADSINVTFSNGLLHEMRLKRNSFMTSLDTMGQHNQIKGRKMHGYFDDLGDLEIMDVDGNGESHYFVLEGDSLFVGMNKIFCSKMRMRFENNDLNNISFYTNPEAKFIPPHELKQAIVFLEGFNWRIEERPEKSDVATYYKEVEKVETKEKIKLPSDLDMSKIKKAIDNLDLPEKTVDELQQTVQPLISK
ncbi:OstA-like protein [Reichenbachiella versicolor]|uniref:OstA-like protein n=1 Tax=Reichenbachiella versicolor TaxID=1821036 RepID=UPI000D6EA1CD|nr:OstA-like protein [Reichenbachiella versicolor]